MATPLWAQSPPPQGRSVQSFNPEIALDGLFSAGYFSEPANLNFGGHDPNHRGFTLENLELTLGATVDPYFRGDAHIVFLIEDGESKAELEEGYVTTLALPAHLQLMGGQFFTRFGRINAAHPHAWDFADQPVVANRLFGPDGLRNPGVQLSWLAPLPVYVELIGSAQDAHGETAASFVFAPGETVGGHTLISRDVRSFGDLIYMGRLRTAWSLSETTEVVLGGSGLFGPNATGLDTRTGIYGVDLYAKWRPLIAERGFPFVAVQAEGLWRRYEAMVDTAALLPAEILRDKGFYVQGVWGFIPRWVAGARVDFADGNRPTDPLGDRRWRLSPNLTFYPSEFSKVRLQYDVDFAKHLNNEALHAVFLQLEFLIGTHGAHTF
jgi:hypothetical protein